jgi:hypothetical protein
VSQTIKVRRLGVTPSFCTYPLLTCTIKKTWFMALVPAAQSGSQRRQQSFRRLLRCAELWWVFIFYFHVYTHKYIHTYICTYIYVCICVYIYIYVCIARSAPHVCIHAYLCIYIRILINRKLLPNLLDRRLRVRIFKVYYKIHPLWHPTWSLSFLSSFEALVSYRVSAYTHCDTQRRDFRWSLSFLSSFLAFWAGGLVS